MDAPSRRGTYGRISGLAALSLLVLAAFSVILVSSSVGGVEGPSLVSHIYRREASAGARLGWRQEGGGEVDAPGSGSGGNNGTKAFSTATGTTISTTSEGLITTTKTRNVTSTTTTRASTSTTTVISTTTTRSTTSSPTSTISTSVSSTTTISTSTSSIPSTTSSSSVPASSSPALKSSTTATSDTPATTLFVPADFLTLATSATSSSTQPGNSLVGGSDPTSTANTGEAVGATQKGFFQNKGAVAGVFVVVALVAICLIGLLFIQVARRRAAARQRRLHAQLFGGKYSKSDDSHGSPPSQVHGRSGSGGSNGGSEKGVVYDNSRFRGATVTSEYPFGPGQGLAAFTPSSSTTPLSQPSPPPMQQTSTFLPPSQNPFVPVATLAGQYSSNAPAYPFNPPNSAGGHSLESHYTNEDPFYTPPASQSHSPNPNIGLQPAMIPALTVTSPHNTQYLPRVPSGSTIFSQPGLARQVQGDGASTYSQQSFEGLAYDYHNSDVFAAGGGASAVPPAGLRGSYGQTSIDSFYGGPASGELRGPTVTVQY